MTSPLAPEKVARICELYLDGYGMPETARLAGVSYRTVPRVLAREGIETRSVGHYSPRAAHRRTELTRRGADHPTWTADQVSYRGAHNRVTRARGRPQECSRCGTTDPAKRYEWANLTGNFADINDYERMCKSCHTIFDRDRLLMVVREITT